MDLNTVNNNSVSTQDQTLLDPTRIIAPRELKSSRPLDFSDISNISHISETLKADIEPSTLPSSVNNQLIDTEGLKSSVSIAQNSGRTMLLITFILFLISLATAGYFIFQYITK